MRQDAMISRRGRRGLWVYFALFLIYLYLPTLLLVLFAFNSGTLPQFPLSGFTLHWFSAAWHTPALRSAIGNSLLVAAGTSLVATTLDPVARACVARVDVRGAARPATLTGASRSGAGDSVPLRCRTCVS
jgi:ABC-type spermidine/putrescine transport system permease subunit II